MSADTRKLAAELRARANRLEAEARALRTAAHRLDPRGRKPGNTNRKKEAAR